MATCLVSYPEMPEKYASRSKLTFICQKHSHIRVSTFVCLYESVSMEVNVRAKQQKIKIESHVTNLFHDIIRFNLLILIHVCIIYRGGVFRFSICVGLLCLISVH